MQDVLKRITELYVENIPLTLQKCPEDFVLYAAFVPFFGWEADPEDHAAHGRQIYILDTEQLDQITSDTTDPDEQSRQAYAWGEFIGGQSLTIESDELSDALLEWYTYQIDQDESTELLDQIGDAIAQACEILNERGWSGPQFTEDFIVFTDCCADAFSNVGVPQSVPEAWLADKRAVGMFGWLDR